MSENESPQEGSWVGRHWRKVADGTYRKTCGRCGGDGQHWAHWVFNGVCFACAGRGVVGDARTLESLVKSDVKFQAKEAAEAAEREAEFEATRAARFAADEEAAYAEYEARAAKAAKVASFEYVGEVGDKVNFEAEVVFTKFIPGDWNRSNTTLVVMKVDETHEVKFFTSAAWAYDIEAGERYQVAATVKDHEVYNDKRSTMLVRPKGIKIEMVNA